MKSNLIKSRIIEEVKRDPSIFQFVPNEYKKDKDIALIAVSNNPLCLEYLDEELQNDTEIVKAAINQHYKFERSKYD